MKKMSYEMALAIINTVIARGDWYCDSGEDYELATALAGSYNYSLSKDYVLFPQTRKLGRNPETGKAVSTLGVLIVPRADFLNLMETGKIFRFCGLLGNGCLQVRREATNCLDFGSVMNGWRWIATPFHTYKDVPVAERKVNGMQRAKGWELLVYDLLCAVYGFENVTYNGDDRRYQYDYTVIINGVPKKFELKGMYGRIKSYSAPKKTRKK